MATKIRGLGRLHVPGHGTCLGVVTDEDIRVDLSTGCTGLAAMLSRYPGREAFQEAITALCNRAGTVIDRDTICCEPIEAKPHLLSPADQQECWGAGCTYQVDNLEKMRRGRPLYAAAYEADRPMLFFKSSAFRVAGPSQPIACHRESRQTIPEAELALLLSPTGEVLAYAMANDVTALDIEQANSLYQPQAKIFDGSCALGPWWTPVALAPDALTTPFTCMVSRQGKTVLQQQVDPGRMTRGVDELAGWLYQSASFPQGAVLMTGGGASVPEGFTLLEGDTVEIAHPQLGELRNQVMALDTKIPIIGGGASYQHAAQV